MRLKVSLEGNTEGIVLACVDMEEIVKMTTTDDIEKSNFNPQMLKSCTDTSYQCGYEGGREDAINEFLCKLETIDRFWTSDKDGNRITPKRVNYEDVKRIANKLKEEK